MKIFSIIVAVITGLLLLSTLICGAWIRAKGLMDTESLRFHMQIGVTSVIFGLISVILLIVLAVKQ